MDPRRASILRVLVTSAIALVLLAAGWTLGNASAAGTAGDRGAITTSIGADVTSLQAEAPSLAGASSIGVPDIPCCQSATTGLTVAGQASLRGTGTRVRDAAIRAAVADATDQARVAAGAAGITLGRIVSMQVNASGYPYPIPLESGVGSAPASGGTACACPPGASCPCPTPVPTTYANVVITWAIS